MAKNKVNASGTVQDAVVEDTIEDTSSQVPGKSERVVELMRRGYGQPMAEEIAARESADSNQKATESQTTELTKH